MPSSEERDQHQHGGWWKILLILLPVVAAAILAAFFRDNEGIFRIPDWGKEDQLEDSEPWLLRSGEESLDINEAHKWSAGRIEIALRSASQELIDFWLLDDRELSEPRYEIRIEGPNSLPLDPVYLDVTDGLIRGYFYTVDPGSYLLTVESLNNQIGAAKVRIRAQGRYQQRIVELGDRSGPESIGTSGLFDIFKIKLGEKERIHLDIRTSEGDYQGLRLKLWRPIGTELRHFGRISSDSGGLTTMTQAAGEHWVVVSNTLKKTITYYLYSYKLHIVVLRPEGSSPETVETDGDIRFLSDSVLYSFWGEEGEHWCMALAAVDDFLLRAQSRSSWGRPNEMVTGKALVLPLHFEQEGDFKIRVEGQGGLGKFKLQLSPTGDPDRGCER